MRSCLPSYMLTILTRLVSSRHCAAAVAGTAAMVAAASGAVSVFVVAVCMLSVLVMKAFADVAEVLADADADIQSLLRDHDTATLAQPKEQHRLHLQQRSQAAFGRHTCNMAWAEMKVAAVAAKRRKWKLGS